MTDQRHSMSCVLGLIVPALLLVGSLKAEDPQPETPQQKLAKRLLALHTSDAAEYTIYRDAARIDKLELRREPIYNWTNVLRSGGQSGAVFVWLYRGRPEAVGSIFSYPGKKNSGQRTILHELHTLSPQVLQPVRDATNRWQPKAGIILKPIPGAPDPADSPRLRLVQMRELARDFSAHSVDYDEKTWELRMLPQPLYRYDSTDPAVIDGALFTFVTSAGTDPEVIVLLDSRQTDSGPKWLYAVCRFSDHNLQVKLKGTEIWTSIRGGDNTWDNDPNHTYRLFTDRQIPFLEQESDDLNNDE